MRMLLSYNFAITENSLSPLDRQGFAKLFEEKLSQNQPEIECRPVNNPHWIVEILFPESTFSPSKIGEMCAQFLASKRKNELQESTKMPDILALGGVKKTPSSSASPDSLKTGEWGVDIVETYSAKMFLDEIAWEAKTSGKNSDTVFKIELKN